MLLPRLYLQRKRDVDSMNMTTFLILLSAFSVISSLITEGIKNMASDRANLSYNLITLIAALLVGSCGTAVYFQLNAIPFTTDNIICLLLTCFASGLTAMVGFDKVKQAIEQFRSK